MGFVTRLREIDGFDLGNIPRVARTPSSALPRFAPLIYHGNRRAAALPAEAVAIPLYKTINRKTGELRYASKSQLASEFKIEESARIILIGSGRDKSLEDWWGLGSSRRRSLAESLLSLGVSLITSPNYSLFTDQVRYDDLYNIKRIFITWSEIVSAGMPCALHVNARTETDYERYAEFVRARPEVQHISFEFGTGGGWPSRREYHAKQLARLGQTVDRRLHLTVLGGMPVLAQLAPVFDLTFVDTTAFMTGVHRQMLSETPGRRLVKRTEATDKGSPLDALLYENVNVLRRRVMRLVA